jgi:hypothetical protein
MGLTEAVKAVILALSGKSLMRMSLQFRMRVSGGDFGRRDRPREILDEVGVPFNVFFRDLKPNQGTPKLLVRQNLLLDFYGPRG